MGTSAIASDLAFLDTEHKVYTANRAAYEREERRLAGGDAVLSELVQFSGESAESYAARKTTASYVNFVRVHASTVTGRLRVHAPTPGKGQSYGKLGEVRTRDKIDTPTMAELVHYNVTGVGNDGSEMPAFFDAVDVRAQATGHRWLFWEAPQRPTDARPATRADELSGLRPYVVEWSPLSVPNWYFKHGQLQFAIVRVETDEPFENGMASSGDLGYYLLVRNGYQGFGATFAVGGWWLFDSEKQLLDSGGWEKTKGQIPMWIHYGDTGFGTENIPAISSSSTMELGQIAVSLMNMISARDYDAWDAASSCLYFLGADSTVLDAVAKQKLARSIMIAVPPAPSTTGDGKTEHIVQVYDSSAGAVASTVFAAIIDSKFREAREQSIMQASSIPSSSGESKEVGDREAKSPLLARRAALRMQSENSFIYFAELRFGFPKPEGFSQWPTEFELQPLVDDIDAALNRLRLNRIESPTLSLDLLERALEEDGLLRPELKATVRAEILASIERLRATEAADRSLFAGIKLGGGADNGSGSDPDNRGTDAAGDRAGGDAGRAVTRRDLRGAATGGPAADRARDADGAGASGDEDVATALAAIAEQLSTLATTIETVKASAGLDSPALRILERMKDTNPAYRITPETAAVLLVEAGVDPETANAMVEAERANIPPLDENAPSPGFVPPEFASERVRVVERIRDTSPSYRIPPKVAVELLVALMLDRATAQAMVDGASKDLPPLQKPEVLPPPQPPPPAPFDAEALTTALTAALRTLATELRPQKPVGRLRFTVDRGADKLIDGGEIIRTDSNSDNGREP